MTLPSHGTATSSPGGVKRFISPTEFGQQLALEPAEIASNPGPVPDPTVEIDPAIHPRQRQIRLARDENRGERQAIPRVKTGLFGQ
jgi:hypothetical protein